MTRGLANKLVEMVEHGLLKSAVFAEVATAQIDEFVKTAGPELRDQFVKLVEKRFQSVIGCFRVAVNYALPNAIRQTVDDNNFDYKYVYVDLDQIPLNGTGEVVEQVHEVAFGEVMYNRDLPAALKRKGQDAGFENGFKFANPLTALRYAKENPEKQIEAPRGILFYIGEQLCYLYLDSDVSVRGLGVYKGYPGDDWGKSVVFLCVPA